MEVIKKRRRRKEDVTTRILYVLVLLVRQTGQGRAVIIDKCLRISCRNFVLVNQYSKLHASEHVGKL